MPVDIRDLTQHIHNLFEDNSDLVEISNLSGREAHGLRDRIQKKYPERYLTGIFVEVRDREDVYTLSIREI